MLEKADAKEEFNLLAERDALKQTLYEIDRNAAWLGAERQRLLWELEQATKGLPVTREAQALKQRLAYVNNTWSWRLTAPFRDWHRRLFGTR